MSTPGIDQMLGQLRAMSALAAGEPSAAPSNAPNAPNFGELLKSSIDQVNQTQLEAQNLQQQFELNPDQTNLQDVMVSLQKASLSFQTMQQVRSKLVAAYQEVMNTQV